MTLARHAVQESPLGVVMRSLGIRIPQTEHEAQAIDLNQYVGQSVLVEIASTADTGFESRIVRMWSPIPR